MAERTLIIGLILFLFAIFFNMYSLPGAVELTIISAPIIAMLLFRYHRMYFKYESNLLIRIFTIINSGFISLLILLAAFAMTGFVSIQSTDVLTVGWALLLGTAAIYYVYHLFKANTLRFRNGYLSFLFLILFHIGEIFVAFYFRNYFSVNALIYSVLLVLIISLVLFIPLIRYLDIPKKHLARSVVVGGIFMYVLVFIQIVPTL